MSITVKDHEVGVEELHSQGLQCMDEYITTSEVAVLRKALVVLQDVVDQSASGSGPILDSRAQYLTSLGRCQRLLFHATSDLSHLEKAITAGLESILAAPEPSLLRPLCAADLSESFAKQYLAKGARDDKDLQDALAMARLAFASTHEGGSYRDIALSALASCLGEHYNTFNGHCYLDEAIQVGRELVSRSSEFLSTVDLINLGCSLKSRHDRYGMMEDLNAAKTYFAEALDALPQGHINHPVAARQFANCLMDIAENTGETHWLDEANAILIPLESETTREECLAKTYWYKSKLYHQKFNLQNKVSDLDVAVEAAKEGLQRVPRDSPWRACLLEAKSCRLGARGEVVMSQEDLDAAIGYATENLALATYTPARLSQAHDTIGTHFRTKYKLFGGVPNLTALIDASRNALHFLPEDHVGRPARLRNLAMALGNYFDHTGQVEFLDEAIRLQREAASKFEASDPDWTLMSILDGLSILLSKRNLLTGSSQDLVKLCLLQKQQSHAPLEWVKDACIFTILAFA